MVPILARSVGFWPVLFPPEGSLGHAPVEALPLPVDADHVVLVQGDLPQRAEDASLLPPREVPVPAAAGAELRRDGLPVTAGSQDGEDAVENLAVGPAGSASRAGSPDPGEERFDPVPEGIGDAEVLHDLIA